MERKITVGYWYIVGGPAGATVTVKGEVNPCCTVPEGGQGSFYAQAPVVIVSDEAITLSQVVNFKCAPVKRWLLGLGRGVSSVLPSGYLAADFLTSNLKEYIDTGIILNQDSHVDLVFQANSVYEDGYLFGSRVSLTQDAMSFYAATPGNTFFIYNTEAPIVIANMTKSALGVLKIRGPEWHVSYAMGDGSVKEASKTFARKNFTTPSSCYLMAINLVDGEVKKGFTGNVYSLSIANQGGMQRVFTPAISADGEPCMFDKVSRKPFYNAGTGSFIVGMTLEQARNLRKLPATGGTLTVSLPWEAQLVQHNADVESALQTAKNNGWTITVQYREPEADSAVYNKYAACTTVEEMQAVNADYKDDLTADGEWVYPLPELTNADYLFEEAINLKKINITLPKVTSLYRTFIRSGLAELILTAPKANNPYQWISGVKSGGLSKMSVVLPTCSTTHTLCGHVKAEEVYLDIPEVLSLSYAFTFSKVKRIKSPHKILKIVNQDDSINETNNDLEEFPWELPYLRSGSRMLNVCSLNKDSALLILNSIPIWTDGKSHLLGIGIHIDLQTDEAVIEAITNAETKGWTLTVRWNGTATTQTASTFGLRRPTIYAKLGTVARPDGTTETVLDWGHYVTNWEENGYQEFSSIEEAEEYFNIIDEA